MDLSKLIRDAGAEGKPRGDSRMLGDESKAKWTPNPNVPQHAKHLGYVLMSCFKEATTPMWFFQCNSENNLFEPEKDFHKALMLRNEYRLDFPQLEWKLVGVTEVSD